MQLKKPKELYKQHTNPIAKFLGDGGLVLGVVPVAIVLALTGHPEKALSLASGILARFSANFISEQKPNQ